MGARRLRLTLVASLCGLACVLGAGVLAAVAVATQAGTTQFGERGSGAGQFSHPLGVAVNNDPLSSAYGDAYVSEEGNSRVDRFSGSGSFQLAWGWGVANGAGELQTCAVSCQAGIGTKTTGGTGEISYPADVAVDNDPLSSSAGDVYVIETGNHRVEKFGPSGEFLLMFGGDVNETTHGDVCAAGEKCQQGTAGPANGQFEQFPGDDRAEYVAVGPGGAVYVGGTARVQVFEPSGAWRETISLSGLSSTGFVRALAVDTTGDIFVKDSQATGVREFEPDGVEKGTQFDAGSSSVTALAVDGSGDLFVGDEDGGFHVLKYLPSGKAVDSFGAGTVKLAASGPKEHSENSFTAGMAFSEATDQVYVPESYIVETPFKYQFFESVWALSVPVPGPIVAAESAVAIPRERATLEGVINPEGTETKYYFEYVDDAQFKANGYTDAAKTPASSLLASLEDHSVSASLAGLSPGTTYHYRLVASNSEGTETGPSETLETLPAISIGAEYATDVASSSATLDAQVDPYGLLTAYRLEYGISTSYEHVVTGDVGESEADVLISVHPQELSVGTVYHYRFTAHNALGTVEGSDHTFMTQAVGEELSLSDGRVWELVSPPDKKGTLIELFEDGLTQAAADGNGISYLALNAIGEGVRGNAGQASQILSTRVPGGWRTQDISIPHAIPGNEESPAEMFTYIGNYALFSPNLSRAVIEPTGVIAPLSPEVSEKTIYLRNDEEGSYLPLVSPADVQTGVSFGGAPGAELHFLGATPDLSHVVLSSPFPLTSESTEPGSCPVALGHEGLCTGAGESANLYEWSGGQLRLVDILPNGEPLQLSYTGESGTAFLGSQRSRMVAHAISDEGRWIVWGADSTADVGNGRYPEHLYVRDMVGEKTFQLGGSHPIFQTMSGDGASVFYEENNELYEFNTATGTQTELTASYGVAESSGGAQNAILGASEDGSTVYFVATGVLAGGASKGADNLYVAHRENGVWNNTFIATLSSADEPDWFGGIPFGGNPSERIVSSLLLKSSRVSPDGRYLAFMSERSLTGYDNLDAVSGQPDEEVYLYDALSNRVVCASCDPTGARPAGSLMPNSDVGVALVNNANIWRGHWVAGILPGWRGKDSSVEGSRSAQYQPRYLSNSGRLFFDSPDALVSQDTNGVEDAYEYEPEGIGSCTDAGLALVRSSSGCVGLISSGISSGESAFLDASETGDDAFFLTNSRLTSADYDNSYDVYDAHVCSDEVPCVALPVPPPPCTSGDSCKAAPSPQPEIFGPAPSATFSGIGNVSEEPQAAVKPKAKKKTKPKKVKKKAKKRSKAKRHKTKKADRTSTVRVGKRGEG